MAEETNLFQRSLFVFHHSNCHILVKYLLLKI